MNRFPIRYAGSAVAAIIGLILLGAGAATAAAPAGGEDAVTWPLDLPEHYLTSNFMEHRPGRFHAGLDFKTRSQTGFVVRAVEDGWIARVRATPGAYGRAVYLRGASGRTFVYAHLARFNERIRETLRPLRTASGVYRARLEFAADEIPVRRGDVLGLSGQAGTKGPHLHFEVRDGAQRPLNPQAEGFAVRDTFAPSIHHVRALPATPDALVMGRHAAAVLEPGALEAIGAVLEISGPVAFSAKITDQSDIRSHVLEPDVVEVRLDGRLVYRSHNERFAFDAVGAQRLEWLDLPARIGALACPAGKVRERWLHRRSGNDLDGREGGLWYLGSAGSGLQPGEHELHILARDFAGSVDEVRIALRVGEPTVSGSKGWRGEPVEYRRALDAARRLTPFFAEGPDSSVAGGTILLSPGRGDPVLADTPVWWWDEPQDETQGAARDAQGLAGNGPCRGWAAADWPVEAAVELSFVGEAGRGEGPNADPRRGVYRWDEDEWEYAGTLLDVPSAAREMRARISERGLYAVFVDRRKPAIGPRAAAGSERRLTVGPGAPSPDAAVGLPRWEIFPVRLLDEGSGVAPETIRTALNGEPLVVEPDLIRDRVLVELPDDLAAGEHTLYLAAADEAGNFSETEIVLECRTDHRKETP